MLINKKQMFRAIGLVGTIVCVALFVHEPSFPTPDKLLVFLTFVFMSLGQAKAMLWRLGPFVTLLLVYESFRGFAEQLNTRVEYNWMITMDKMLFGSLPTITLQHWFWHGSVRWYDFVFYLCYMSHFVIPLGVAILIWKYRERFYWQYVWTYVVVSFMGFVTFLAFPAAPPWLAVQQGYIQAPFTRISSSVWAALGVHDFPSVYDKLSPNAVAAVPSLHAAYATLLVIFIYKLFGKKWAVLATLYPLVIYVGTVYSGEHYAIDEIIGVLYAIVAFWLVSHVYKRTRHVQL